MLDHFLCDFEIGDHAVAQGPDRLDIAGRSTEHLLGLLTHGQHLLLTLQVRDGDDRWLIQHDALSFYVDQSVRRAEVDGHVGGK